MSNTIIDKIDEALKDDKLETRQGLRFMATVLREAMKAIDEANEGRASTNTRLFNMEHGLNEFLEKQTGKEKKADEERTKWRWVIMTPMIAYVGVEILKWIFR